MKILKVLASLSVALALINSGACGENGGADSLDAGPSAGGDGSGLDSGSGNQVPWQEHWLEVLWPHESISAWQFEKHVLVRFSNGMPDEAVTLDDLWRSAIVGVLEISDASTGDRITYEIAAATPGTNEFEIVPATPFASGKTYRLKLNPPSAQTSFKDLNVFGIFGRITAAAECRFAHTYSRPLISSVTVALKEEDNYAYVGFTMTEVIRKESMDSLPKPTLLVDGIDLTACQGPPPACCNMELTADGGMTPDSGCHYVPGSWTYGDEIIDGEVKFFFRVPSAKFASFSSIQIHLPAAWKGVTATVADAIAGVPEAMADGDLVVWIFERSMMQPPYGGNGNALNWFAPCE